MPKLVSVKVVDEKNLYLVFVLYCCSLVYLVLCRVDGHGEATISEVALTVKHVAPVTDEGKKRKEDKLQAELEALQHRLNVLQVKRTRLVKQRQVLDGFADQLTNGRAANEKSVSVEVRIRDSV